MKKKKRNAKIGEICRNLSKWLPVSERIIQKFPLQTDIMGSKGKGVTLRFEEIFIPF